MTLTERNIKNTEAFPVDYQILREDDFIHLKYGQKEEYCQVTNRQRVLQRLATDDANWLLAPGTEKNAGDVSDWLQPETGAYKVLYILAFGIFSDRNLQVQVSNTKSGDSILGTKTQGIARVTPSISSIEEPTVTIMALDTTFSPSFRIRNPSEYTPKSCVLGVKGFKYRLQDIKPAIDASKNVTYPRFSTTINLNNLLES